MRSDQEMMELILTAARDDERIRAVMMNGSRVNSKAPRDKFQDYDIVCFVTDLASFTADHSWVDIFGERLIMQMPDEMQLYPEDKDNPHRFAYLMKFTDGNRLDLTLVDQLPETFDSLSRILLDKDDRLPDLPEPSDADYLVKKPSRKEFSGHANEFWWVSTYVAKGLWRRELPYAKSMMEGPVRSALKRMVSWYIGVRTDFSVSVGSEGKYFEHYLEDDVWTRYAATYAGGDYESMWDGLFAMVELFCELGSVVGDALDYERPVEEEVFAYLKWVRGDAGD
ncbi:aminoglycoside 6-adenylyltransferase [Halobacillus rhizosphaerae]|uniref:aminoglycoside 6-adenylyltransferase n=1 Tax=Halobacillus rhizosphaerae TaxID=3064889 RepID=UPI00398B09B0